MEVESLGVREEEASFQTSQEIISYEGTTQSMTSVEGKTYQVKIPWRDDVKGSIAENNCEVAEKRLCNRSQAATALTSLSGNHNE